MWLRVMSGMTALMDCEAFKHVLVKPLAMSFCHEDRRADMKKLHCMTGVRVASAQRVSAHFVRHANDRHHWQLLHIRHRQQFACHSFVKESMHTCGALLTTAFSRNSLRSWLLHLWSVCFASFGLRKTKRVTNKQTALIVNSLLFFQSKQMCSVGGSDMPSCHGFSENQLLRSFALLGCRSFQKDSHSSGAAAEEVATKRLPPLGGTIEGGSRKATGFTFAIGNLRIF